MSANGSLSSMSANGGLSAMSAGNSLTTASAGNYTISAMSSGSATTCYKSKDKYYDVTITPVIKQSLEINDNGFHWPKWSLGFEISIPAILDSTRDAVVAFIPLWDDLTYKNDAATTFNPYLENSITLLGKTQFDKDTALQEINEREEIDKACWEDSHTPECEAKYDAHFAKWPEAPTDVGTNSFAMEADLDTGTYFNWYYGSETFSIGGLFADWELPEVATTFTLPEYRTDVANQVCDWIKNSSSILTIRDYPREGLAPYSPLTIISAEDIKWGDCKVETEDFPHVASSGTTPCDKADSIFYMDEDIENGRYETLKPGYCKEILAMHNIQWSPSGEPVYENIGRTKACCTKASMDSEYTRYVVSNNDYPYDVNDKKTIGCGMTCSSNYALPILKLFIGSVNTAYTYEIKDVSYNPEVQPYDRIGITYRLMTTPVTGGEPYKTEIVDDTHNHGLPPGKYTLTITTTGIHAHVNGRDHELLPCRSGKVEKTIDIVITGQNEYEYLYISPEKCQVTPVSGYQWSQ